MPARTLPNVGLQAFFDLGEDGWNDEYDLNMLKLSVLTQGGILGVVAALPVDAENGDVYILSAGAHIDSIAIRDADDWIYVVPKAGWLMYNRDTGKYLTYDGLAWNNLATGSGDGGSTVPAVPPDIRGTVQANAVSFQVVLPFPVGTVEGDLAIVHAGTGYGVNGNPAGWTMVVNASTGYVSAAGYWKVLTAADIATGSVTVGFSGNYDCGGILTIIKAGTFDPDNPISDSDAQQAVGAPVGLSLAVADLDAMVIAAIYQRSGGELMADKGDVLVEYHDGSRSGKMISDKPEDGEDLYSVTFTNSGGEGILGMALMVAPKPAVIVVPPEPLEDAPEDGKLYGRKDGEWEEVPAGGGSGGGGGLGGTPPTMVQMATMRGDGTISLAEEPTPGNLMVAVVGGYRSGIYTPPGFVWNGQQFSNGNNAVAIMSRTVQEGDTGSYALSASDNQFIALYEFSGATGVDNLNGGYLAVNGNAFYIEAGKPISAIRIVAGENDTASYFSIDAEDGLTVDYATPNDGQNHTGFVVRIDDTFEGRLTGTISNGFSAAVFGVFDVLGTGIAAPEPETISSDKWRLRAVLTRDDFEWGVGELRFLDSEGNNLCVGGNAVSSGSYDGNWPASEAFDGLTGDQNGWYSKNDRGMGAWVGYEFPEPVSPAQISFCPVWGYLDAMPFVGAVDYEVSPGVWKELCQVLPVVPGANETFQTFDLPIVMQVVGGSGGGGGGGGGPAMPSLYRFGGFFNATPGDGEVLLRHVATDAFTLPADLDGSQFHVGTNPAANTILRLRLNGVEIASIAISPTGDVAMDGAGGDVEAGDLLTLHGPALADGTIADCAFTFRGEV